MRFELEQGTGECRVGADGLYWVIDAVCTRSGPDAPRLYCDGRSLGPFWPEDGKWRLQTRVSNRALPITPQSVFTLSPPDLVPYDPSQPLPMIDRFTELVPVMWNGKMYLKHAQLVM